MKLRTSSLVGPILILLGLTRAAHADLGVYVEPTAFLVLGSTSAEPDEYPRPGDTRLFIPKLSTGLRGAAGLWWRQCRDGAEVRVGGTLLITTDESEIRGESPSEEGRLEYGFGAEIEASFPLHGRPLRVSGRLGFEDLKYAGLLVSTGARLHVRETISFGLEVFRFGSHGDLLSSSAGMIGQCKTRSTGLMMTVGFHRQPYAAIPVGIGVVVALLVHAIAPRGHSN